MRCRGQLQTLTKHNKTRNFTHARAHTMQAIPGSGSQGPCFPFRTHFRAMCNCRGVSPVCAPGSLIHELTSTSSARDTRIQRRATLDLQLHRRARSPQTDASRPRHHGNSVSPESRTRPVLQMRDQEPQCNVFMDLKFHGERSICEHFHASCPCTPFSHPALQVCVFSQAGEIGHAL